MEIFDLWIFEIFYWDLNIWCVWAAHVSLNTDSCCLWGWKGQTLTFHGWWRPQPPFWNLRSLADKTGSGTQTWHQEKKLISPFFSLPSPCQWCDPEWQKVLMWRHGGFPDSSLHWHRWAEPLVEPRWGSPDGWKVDSAIAEDTLPSASVNISKHSSQQPKLTSFTSIGFRLAGEEIKYL